jgi:ankyrin repeat protein
MSTRELPARPNLEHLKNQAHTLLQESLAGDAQANARFAPLSLTSAEPRLADALHVIAREYGFATWPALKAHVETSSEDPVEALTAAVRANSAQLVREVLARHASLRPRLSEPLPNPGFDSPAIVIAASRDNREMVDALLDAGADINARSRWWAGSYGVLDSSSEELATYLIGRGAYVDIHAAARLGRIDRVRELLSADPQLVHARGGDGQFPLHFAATIEIAALLLDGGAAIDAQDIDHESTAVQYMVSTKPHRHDVAMYLIARGAQADIFAAAAVGDLALAEQILNDDPETVRATVSEHSFPKKNPKSGGIIYIYGFGWTWTPHMVAQRFGHTAVFDLLMQRSAPWLRLVQAAEAGDAELARQIVAKQPSLIARLNGFAGRRIVGVALRNNTRAVEMLLGYGWPVDATLENQQTALHYAAWNGNLAMTQSLLSHNAPVNVFETQHGGSPLAWALHGSLHGWERAKGDYVGVTRALLAAGANIPKPEQPLEAADEVLEVLRQHVASA